jgi:membrane protein DedA with SNARE-associated domain
MILECLIDTYGYWAILVGTIFEGETVLLLGGFVASRGYLNLPWVILMAFIGGLCGDQLFFLLGRRYSGRILARRPSWQSRADRVHKLLERFQTSLILIYRFMYGFRSITPFVIGTSPIPYRRFILFNILAVLLWAASIGIGGYLFGSALEAFIGDLKKYEFEILITVAATGLGIWMIYFFRRRRQG